MTQELKLSVLGPVRGWQGNAELNLGAPQQRAVLAMLTLAGGRHVTLDALISGLWEEEPPLAAVGTVRTYVSRLRRSIAAGGAGGLIQSAGTGYVVPAPAVALDVAVFERMTKDALAIRNGSPAEKDQAAALLRDALRLSQGVPLAGLPGPYAESQRLRISELQLAATEERLALDIELGGHVAATAELQALLADYPTRERLSELLMLALYRSGRQTDALAAFDSARHLLGDEFGVNPGPGLRYLQERILHNDPGLIAGQSARSAGEAPAAPPTLPRPLAQLPTDLPVFAGRRRELARLDSFLGDGAGSEAAVAITAIDGMAGMGKTALAVHWAHRVADRFPDGQLYVNLRGFDPCGTAMTAGEALRGFLCALGVTPEHIPENADARASLYRSMLHGRRVLVLLDNARDMAQVRPLLPGSPGCLVIVTSRNRLLGLITTHGAHSVTLEPLSAADARQALELRLDAAQVAADPLGLAEIIDRCAGLPLAIAVIAARATVYRDLSLGEIASELRDARTRLDALSTDDATADVRTVFSWSYRSLSESAQRLFRHLSVHPGPDISRNAAVSLAGRSRAETQQLLAELTGARLLTEHRPGRFSAHDLIRAYAAELSGAYDSPSDRRAALQRLLDHYLHTAHAAHLLLQPAFAVPEPDQPRAGVSPEELSDYQQAMVWFDAERQVLQDAVGHATQHEFLDHAWRLALTLQEFCQRQGYWHDWAATLRVALPAALGADDVPGQAHIHRGLAGAYYLLGQDREAIAELRQAGELPGQAGYLAGQGYLHSVCGAIFARQGSHDEAAAHYGQAYELYEAAGHRAGQANALQGIGGCRGQQGRHGEATSLVYDAMTIYRELRDPNGEGHCWTRLGESHRLLGEYTQAMACYQRAAALWQELGNRAGEATALVSVGDSAIATGKHGQAREAWETALIILTKLGLSAADEVRRKLSRMTEAGERRAPSLAGGAR